MSSEDLPNGAGSGPINNEPLTEEEMLLRGPVESLTKPAAPERVVEIQQLFKSEQTTGEMPLVRGVKALFGKI